MIHDTAESKVDTTVQSLLGRCCGYNKNKEIEIYCDMISAKKYKDWIISGFDIDMVPDKSKNVLSGGNNEFTINTVISPVEYSIPNDIMSILSKKRKTEEDKREIINKLNLEKIDILNSDYGVSLLSPIKSSSYKKQYEEPLKAGTFFSDYKKHYKKIGDANILIPEYEGKYIISLVSDHQAKDGNSNNKITVSVGRIDKISTQVQTSEKSMYHSPKINN